MGSFSIWHWLIVLAIVVLIFGTKRLRGAGGDLGAAVKNFKSSMKEGEAEASQPRTGEISGPKMTADPSPTSEAASARDEKS